MQKLLNNFKFKVGLNNWPFYADHWTFSKWNLVLIEITQTCESWPFLFFLRAFWDLGVFPPSLSNYKRLKTTDRSKRNTPSDAPETVKNHLNFATFESEMKFLPLITCWQRDDYNFWKDTSHPAKGKTAVCKKPHTNSNKMTKMLSPCFFLPLWPVASAFVWRT